jgi:nitroreductase
MELSMQAIKSRTSVRTYDGTALTAADERALHLAFEEAVPGPFGGSPRFMLATRDEIEDAASRATSVKGGVRIGTYGMMVGPRSFIAGVIAKRPFACVDFGYCLEGIVLRATELGLGTCWIGGAFARGAIARALGASKDEFVPATTPIGRAAKRPTLQERLVRGSARAGTRKHASELFFEVAKTGELDLLTSAGEWAEVLEAVRIGPSASNKQPWRLAVDRREGEALHLSMHEDRAYNNMLGDVKLQELDMGIAMRHVEVAAGARSLKGSWERRSPDPIVLEEPSKYIATFALRS